MKGELKPRRAPIVSRFYIRVVKIGGNLTVTIPRAIVRELHVSRGELAQVTRIPGRAFVITLQEDSPDGRIRRDGTSVDDDRGTAAPAPVEHRPG